MKNLASQLQERRQQQLYRERLVVDGPQGVVVRIDGRDYLSFCSNDYLGLANHPEVVAAFHHGLDEFGSGSGAAHLITGHSRAHHVLEEELASFVQRPRALLFSTGYSANLGIISSLLGRSDRVFEDRLNHASLLDAARLSNARLLRYPHVDTEVLASQLAAAPASEYLVATDAVFSMDGDSAPLARLSAVAAQHDAWLLVDDAHGLGVLGPHGRGSVAGAGLGVSEVPILMGTLGKAFGTFGAFVAGSDDLVETLIQQARTYIYTTAPPPAVACATRAALQRVREDDWRREHLQALIKRFRTGAMQLGLALCDSQTPIQPLLVGTAGQALKFSLALREQGILITAIRPPTVAEGSSRLRITFSAMHSEVQVDRLLAALERAGMAARDAAGAAR
ncbi:MAG: 8-amino-7-oxononanoate synthase [Gammaproteobacteria bacterium]|jgi:8-amino-7-oxononanoate synthase|nr:8-amino-7-oxononanoate synthase [Gammaproteobacteria bacterium]